MIKKDKSINLGQNSFHQADKRRDSVKGGKPRMRSQKTIDDLHGGSRTPGTPESDKHRDRKPSVDFGKFGIMLSGIDENPERDILASGIDPKPQSEDSFTKKKNESFSSNPFQS